MFDWRMFCFLLACVGTMAVSIATTGLCVLLKLFGVLTLSWRWTLSPVWIGFVLVAVIILIDWAYDEWRE